MYKPAVASGPRRGNAVPDQAAQGTQPTEKRNGPKDLSPQARPPTGSSVYLLHRVDHVEDRQIHRDDHPAHNHPSATIMIGSIAASRASTAVSTSSS